MNSSSPTTPCHRCTPIIFFSLAIMPRGLTEHVCSVAKWGGRGRGDWRLVSRVWSFITSLLVFVMLLGWAYTLVFHHYRSVRDTFTTNDEVLCRGRALEMVMLHHNIVPARLIRGMILGVVLLGFLLYNLRVWHKGWGWHMGKSLEEGLW